MIYIVLDSLPPSSNQAYFNAPSKKGKNGAMQRGGRVLTTAGKAYKSEVVNHIAKHHGMQTQQLKKDATIGCLIAYGFPDLLSKNWPEKAQWRYRKNDLANRPKLLQDAIVEATSIDDSQICFDYKYKYASEKPQTTIYIWNEDEEPFGQQLLAAFTSIIGRALQVQSH
jgi:Holliday junction resolvase RusA-like endonuclease